MPRNETSELTRIEDMRVTERVPSVQSPDQIKDRRRPGRVENISRHLVPLLRNPTRPVIEDRDIDDLAPATGIIVTLMISTVIWATVVALVWFL